MSKKNLSQKEQSACILINNKSSRMHSKAKEMHKKLADSGLIVLYKKRHSEELYNKNSKKPADKIMNEQANEQIEHYSKRH